MIRQAVTVELGDGEAGLFDTAKLPQYGDDDAQALRDPLVTW